VKNASFLLLFFAMMVASTGGTYAQTAWVTKKIDNKLSVKFPEEPTKTTKNGVETYILKSSDSTSYSSALVDFNVLVKLDSATLAPIKDTKEFAAQMKDGIAAQKTNYTFSDIVIGTWKNYTTYSMTALDTSKKKKLFTYMILIGSKMYTLSCLVPDGLVNSVRLL
jgi:hypothetical protein